MTLQIPMDLYWLRGKASRFTHKEAVMHQGEMGVLEEGTKGTESNNKVGGLNCTSWVHDIATKHFNVPEEDIGTDSFVNDLFMVGHVEGRS